jgi:prophage DNA circulation protein
MSEWRDRLQPASFRGAQFKVELGARAGGRRVQIHEFPKRDEPYAEDMGRRARAHPITAYLVGSGYQTARDRLLAELEKEGAGALVHPTLGTFNVVCATYTVIERRERGGYVEFDLQFLEAGSQTPVTLRTATPEMVQEKAEAATISATAAVNEAISV